jgi:microcystin-dependent protein
MSNCTNCYNGCTEIVSDRCVKYTGINIPTLGIQTGDTLSFVEQALISFLLSTLNGTGIKIDLGNIDVCTVVQKYLPTCGDLTIVDISKALVQAACDLQEQVDAIDAELAILNADYTIPIGPSPTFTPCLTGVTASSDTHAIVQAVINKVCAIQVDLVALALDLETNYVPKGEPLNNYIAAYLASTGTSTLVSSKMVPYSILPYYGDLSHFNGTGAGTGDWDRIFLCNGLNSTPDLRGRVPVGVTSMLNASFPSQTQPGLNGNPDYNAKGITTFGANQVTLNETQLPAHTHLGATVAAGEHTHNTKYGSAGTGTLYAETPYISDTLEGTAGLTTANGIHTHPVTISSTGGGLPHSNIQPVISLYYIIYIPL